MTPATLAPVRGTGATGLHTGLSIPAELGAVAFVRAAAACLLEREAWPADGAGRLLLSVSEAVVNAVEHGSPAGGQIEVELVVGPDRAQALVTDQGRPGGRTPRLPASEPPPSSLRGRGLLIMERLSDGLGVAEAGDGTRIWIEVLRTPVDPLAPGLRLSPAA